MAKKPGPEVRVRVIRALDPSLPSTIAVLRKALTEGWYVAAAAVEYARAHNVYALADDLAAAYATYDDRKADPICAARIAIVRALDAINRWDEAICDRGSRTIQLVSLPEGDLGEPDDAAANLRIACGLAYVNAVRDDTLDVLARLLGDRIGKVRMGAAQALGASGRSDAAALLRYVLQYIDEPSVEAVEAQVEALIILQRTRATAFLIELLPDEARRMRGEVIALGLATARVVEARDALVAWSERLGPADRLRVGFLPLALLRDDAANAYLVARIADPSPGLAIAAATALATFAADPAIAALIREAGKARGDRHTSQAILALLE